MSAKGKLQRLKEKERRKGEIDGTWNQLVQTACHNDQAKTNNEWEKDFQRSKYHISLIICMLKN